MVASRSPAARLGTGLSRQRAASILVYAEAVPPRWYASPVYPIDASSRSTRKPQARTSSSLPTNPATHSLIGGVARMYVGDSPRRNPMFCTAIAVFT